MTSQTIMPEKKRTSYWPYAIIVVYVLFAAYIGYMVKQAMSTTVDLVSPDYYQRELNFQEHINSAKRNASLTEAVTIVHDNNTGALTIQLPEEFAGKEISGMVHFFRPSDLTLDFKVPLQPNADLSQQLNTQKLANGYWRILLDYTVDGRHYYTQQNLTITKK